MPDIIVTVPKGEIVHFERDKIPAHTAYWRMGRGPKDPDEVEYIGFVYYGGIRVIAKVKDIRPFAGKVNVYFGACQEIALIPHEHFRGFRYYDLSETLA